MNCPFCHHDITPHKEEYNLGTDSIGYWKLAAYKCPNPECQKLFLYLARLEIERTGPPRHTYIEEKPIECFLIYPKGATRKKAPPEVPIEIAKDFNEAVLILNDSPRASAALSRRCLQNILREKAKVKPGNLSDEIQEIIDRKELPSYLAECLDHIRIIGNFAAHPIKSERTGEIIDVEPDEAEYALEVLELLFNFYFVQPEKMRKMKEALDKKRASIKDPKKR